MRGIYSVCTLHKWYPCWGCLCKQGPHLSSQGEQMYTHTHNHVGLIHKGHEVHIVSFLIFQVLHAGSTLKSIGIYGCTDTATCPNVTDVQVRVSNSKHRQCSCGSAHPTAHDGLLHQLHPLQHSDQKGLFPTSAWPCVLLYIFFFNMFREIWGHLYSFWVPWLWLPFI